MGRIKSLNKKLIKNIYKDQVSNIELIQTELTNLDIPKLQ